MPIQKTEKTSLIPKVVSRKLPFNQIPHFNTVNTLINKIETKPNQSPTNKNEELNGLTILTDQVLYMQYENTHTYTFKTQREKPEFYIENIVLHYNIETNKYDEYLLQYNATPEQYLAIVNNEVIVDHIPVIVYQLDNGSSGIQINRSNITGCETSCTTINVNCSNGGNHSPGQSCNPGTDPDNQAYSYVSCHAKCYEVISSGNDTPSGTSGGGGGASSNPINTNPMPTEPCNNNSDGSGGVNPGIESPSGQCAIPMAIFVQRLNDAFGEGNWRFNNSISNDAPSFNSVQEAYEYIEYMNTELAFESTIQVNPNTKITRFTVRLGAVLPYNINIRIKMDTDNKIIKNVNSSDSGFTLANTWTQLDYSSSINNNIATVNLFGKIDYDLFINGVGTVFTSIKHYQMKINVTTGKPLDIIEIE